MYSSFGRANHIMLAYLISVLISNRTLEHRLYNIPISDQISISISKDINLK